MLLDSSQSSTAEGRQFAFCRPNSQVDFKLARLFSSTLADKLVTTGQSRVDSASSRFCAHHGDAPGMKSLFRNTLQWLADSRLGRCLADALLKAKARRRLAELDQQSFDRCQKRTLLGLIHRARSTRFGREHDFRRIRSAEDFQRLVPLRTPAELWREYWQPAFPDFSGATWPGPIPYLAVSASASSGQFPYIPFSPEMWAAQQTAALTALAFMMHARPKARFCAGRVFLLGGGTTLADLGDIKKLETLETLAIRKLPAALQPYAFSTGTVGNRAGLDEQLLASLAGRSALQPVTSIAGTAERLLAFFAHARRLTGHSQITEIWPQLAAVLYASSESFAARRQLVEELAGDAPLLIEMLVRPEGAIALEDPRYGFLRLIPDHGCYFEFVPMDDLGKSRPSRCSLSKARTGVPYALALSSPAGVWSCLIGCVIKFERLDPPLFHLVEGELLRSLPAPLQAPRHTATIPLPPAQPPHRRSVGRPVVLQGRSSRNAW